MTKINIYGICLNKLTSNQRPQRSPKSKIETDSFIKQKKYEIASLQSQIEGLESKTKYRAEEIKSLEYKKDNVQSLQILKPPTSSPYPIKPKKIITVILATMVGLFMTLFLSFFLEYISRNPMMKASVKNAK